MDALRCLQPKHESHSDTASQVVSTGMSTPLSLEVPCHHRSQIEWGSWWSSYWQCSSPWKESAPQPTEASGEAPSFAAAVSLAGCVLQSVADQYLSANPQFAGGTTLEIVLGPACSDRESCACEPMFLGHLHRMRESGWHYCSCGLWFGRRTTMQ